MTNVPPDTPAHIHAFENSRLALEHLSGFFFGPQLFESAFEVAPDEVPSPFDALLVHRAHMTNALERFHGAPPALEVIEDRLDGDIYQRKILLTVSGTNHVIEVGIVRIALNQTPDDVRREILERRQPLGDILIRHNVLRSIEPKWYFRFEGPPALFAAFDRPIDGPLYGRIGVIHCNGEAAIELLEVVSGDKMG